MPAASSKAELLELAAERSWFKPAASWNPIGRPRSCAGAWALLCDADRCGVAAATGPWIARATTVALAVRRNAGMDVDKELVLDDDFVDDAPGYGTGCGAGRCACGGGCGLSPASAPCGAAANARSAHAATNILRIEAFALTTRDSPPVAVAGMLAQRGDQHDDRDDRRERDDHAVRDEDGIREPRALRPARG
jgi:hypothetical protein